MTKPIQISRPQTRLQSTGKRRLARAARVGWQAKSNQATLAARLVAADAFHLHIVAVAGGELRTSQTPAIHPARCVGA